MENSSGDSLSKNMNMVVFTQLKGIWKETSDFLSKAMCSGGWTVAKGPNAKSHVKILKGTLAVLPDKQQDCD